MEVTSQFDKIIIGNICCPPQGNFIDFIETITSSLDEFPRSFSDNKLIYMGDFNIDFFIICSDSRVMNFYLQLLSYD